MEDMHQRFQEAENLDAELDPLKPVVLPRNRRSFKKWGLRQREGRIAYHARSAYAEYSLNDFSTRERALHTISSAKHIVAGNDDVGLPYLFSNNALRSPKECHDAVKQRQSEGLKKFLEDWCGKNVTPEAEEATRNWFTGGAGMSSE